MKNIQKHYFNILLISYVTLLIIPLLTGSIAYLISKKAVEEEVFRANSAILEQAKFYIDKQLEQEKLLVSQIILNSRINEFLRICNPMDEREWYLLYNIKNDLSTYKSMYPFISDFYIYFKNSDIIVTPTDVYSTSMFYKYIYNYSNIKYADWKSTILQGYHNNTFIPSQSMSIPSTQKYITFIRSLPIDLNQPPYANLVILIDEQNLKSLFGDVKQFNGGFMFIVDKKGEIVTTNDSNNLLKSLTIKKLEDSEGWSIVNTSKGTMAMSYISSEQQEGWKYVFLTPTSIFMSKVIYIKRTTFCIFLVSLFGELFLTIFQACKNYFPVKKILRELSMLNNGLQGGKFNEFDFISKTINHIKEEYKRIKQLLDEQKPIIRNNLIILLLEGKEDSTQSMINYLREFDIEFPYDSFAVLVFDLDEHGVNLEGCFGEQWTLFKLAISNYLQNASFYKACVSYTIEIGKGKLVLLLNINSEMLNNGLDNFETLLKDMQNCIVDSIELHYTIGVGSIHPGLSGISKSYSEANRALEYRVLKGHGAVIRYSDIVEYDQIYYYPIETEQQIVNCLKAGEFEKTIKVFDYIFDENLNKRRLSPNMLKLLFSNIIGTVVKVIINELKVDFKTVFHSDFDPITYLSNCSTTTDIQNRLYKIIGDLCIYINENKKSHNEILLEEIYSYIQKEYPNPNLCLQMIASHLNISVPYLSRFFKEQTGKNLNNYINEIRIEKAKELMTNNQFIIISEVARLVGFNNDASFIRVFKKLTGITPGCYKQSILNKKVQR